MKKQVQKNTEIIENTLELNVRSGLSRKQIKHLDNYDRKYILRKARNNIINNPYKVKNALRKRLFSIVGVVLLSSLLFILLIALIIVIFWKY
ncbi:hypothetical protein [Mycoplasma zalophidermidis]|uniref:Uncharacterized protein n=1 Tax=Mycoplasma zalophidermidis TaxID=398174 RepID=A0ABS6DSK8_9MOLU|nr:hypothetical protein [Mycoplasma zalophidermidis]MBU4689992.1 hypothetical protein [Mycoplasma zalophidermidis]MBU4693854.1 hypothetical protein [Mycoplasma zalophidermidis]MCR8966839.1 hypothetical protein [Mycoplasma zalophidermidis]